MGGHTYVMIDGLVARYNSIVIYQTEGALAPVPIPCDYYCSYCILSN